MFFRRRDIDGIDPWLREKTALFTAGAATALLGMFLDEAWVIGLAVLLLFGGLALRWIPRDSADRNTRDDDAPS
jgi:hypothetical protein